MKPKANSRALLPVLVFLVLYLGMGILFEYVLKIPMGFYSIPIVVVFLAALLVAPIFALALVKGGSVQATTEFPPHYWSFAQDWREIASGLARDTLIEKLAEG